MRSGIGIQIGPFPTAVSRSGTTCSLGGRCGPRARTVTSVPDLRTAIANAVRAERARAQISQDQLAERLGWTRSMVTKTELGQRDIAAHELPGICRALGVTLDRLLVDADPADREALGI